MKTMFGRLTTGLSKTRKGVFDKIGTAVTSRNDIDEDLFEDLEEILISGYVGVNISQKLVEDVRATITDLGIKKPENIIKFLKIKLYNNMDIDL